MGRDMRVPLTVLALAMSFHERARSHRDQTLARITVHTTVSALDRRRAETLSFLERATISTLDGRASRD
ncbi:hypothetical protein NL676_021646 [Syzygium grande]|nr:hypothetical protein NL676_021646 [Syzygium grande]